jgi:hypothetical protein
VSEEQEPDADGNSAVRAAEGRLPRAKGRRRRLD